MTKGTKPQEYYFDEAGRHPVFGLDVVLTEDSIKDTHIDWGTGAGQVSAEDMPIADAGSRYTGTEVEAALQELAGSGRTTETVKANADAIATKVPTSRQIIAGTGLTGGGDLTVDRTLSLNAGWYKIADPSTGWLASKGSGWTADSFTGGLEVDFSAVVPANTKAVRIVIHEEGTFANAYYRKSGDSNISNTPDASGEWSHLICTTNVPDMQATIWLSVDYKAQFAVNGTDTNLYLAYPVEYML